MRRPLSSRPDEVSTLEAVRDLAWSEVQVPPPDAQVVTLATFRTLDGRCPQCNGYGSNGCALDGSGSTCTACGGTGTDGKAVHHG